MASPFDFATIFFIGGAISGVPKTILAPIERVQMLLQLQGTIKGMEDPCKKYKGIFNCISRIFKEQGFMSFWRGNLSNIIRYFPYHLITLVTKPKIVNLLPKYDPKTHYWKALLMNTISDSITECLSLCICYPFDFIRTRMAADIGKNQSDREFKGMADVINKIMKTDGISGIYRGINVTIIEIFLYRFLYFGMLDTCRKHLLDNTKKSNIFLVWLLAQFTTIFLRFITYPLDTIRRKMMMQSGRNNMLYDNTIDCIAKIYMKEGGIKGFFRGVGCNFFNGIAGSLFIAFMMTSKNP
ncbi:hypothetical protein SteCoe_32171 [Stentor coeruleus]|uniref:ADP/ATP translocase n=1 Tax=Stentor coeruleus TaxID=5963 RepID=A0A1R2AZK8_9CILI|nr:hypothetical protein SteCoe_32171 [Stentor coeruleus]